MTLVLLGGGCTVGEGVGTVRGQLRVPICGIDDDQYDLRPQFYGAEWQQGSLAIHVSQGGDTGEFSDELVLRVTDTAYIAAHLNERIAVGPPGATPVQAILRLNRACGRQSITRYAPNVGLEAMQGYVVFAAVYRGDPGGEAAARLTHITEFSLSLRDARLVSNLRLDRPLPEGPREPPALEETRAELEGELQFYFSRGRPAQRFQ
jgi:hypothetical protein